MDWKLILIGVVVLGGAFMFFGPTMASVIDEAANIGVPPDGRLIKTTVVIDNAADDLYQASIQSTSYTVAGTCRSAANALRNSGGAQTFSLFGDKGFIEVNVNGEKQTQSYTLGSQETKSFDFSTCVTDSSVDITATLLGPNHEVLVTKSTTAVVDIPTTASSTTTTTVGWSPPSPGGAW